MPDNRQLVLWPCLRALAAGLLFTCFSHYLIASATRSDSFTMVRHLDPTENPSPTYLNHLLPPHHAVSLWRVRSNDDRERKLLIFSPHFGADRIGYDFQHAVEAPTIWIQGEQSLIPSSAVIDRSRFGWPFRSVYHDSLATVPSSDPQLLDDYFAAARPAMGIHLGIKAPDWWPKAQGVHRLPLVPIWPGLLANTAIFAAAWFTPGFVWRTARTRRRQRRHQCVTCGYDKASLTVCPECGPTSTQMPHA